MKLDDLKKNHPYNELIKDLRNPSVNPQVPASPSTPQEPPLFFELFNQLRKNQIQLVISLVPSLKVREWNEEGQPVAFHPHSPYFVARRFIIEYIRYSQLCGIESILQHQGVNFEIADHVFAFVLKFLSQQNQPTDEQDTLQFEMLLEQEFPNFGLHFFKHYMQFTEFSIAGNILDRMIWPQLNESPFSWWAGVVRNDFKLLQVVVENPKWIESFFNLGHKLLMNWHDSKNVNLDENNLDTDFF